MSLSPVFDYLCGTVRTHRGAEELLVDYVEQAQGRCPREVGGEISLGTGKQCTEAHQLEDRSEDGREEQREHQRTDRDPGTGAGER